MLRVKNLTPWAIDIVRAEYLDLGSSTRDYNRQTWSLFAARDHNATETKGEREQVDRTSSLLLSGRVTIGPFCSADVLLDDPPDRSSEKRLRLVLESRGDEFQVDTPAAASASSWDLVPLNADVESSLRAVYHAGGCSQQQQQHLSILPCTPLRNWMQDVPDDTPLSALSIPGTHNSPTYYRALPSVRCQAASVPEQLRNGVRFLDVRAQPEGPICGGNNNNNNNDNNNDDAQKSKSEKKKKLGLILVHGAFPVSLTGGTRYFAQTQREIAAFLAENPSETVVLSMKREGTGSATDAHFARVLREHYVRSPDAEGLWYAEPRIPRLREVRGKIVLLRRFGLDEALETEGKTGSNAEGEEGDQGQGQGRGRGFGLDAEFWIENSPYTTCPSGDICVQDFYDILDATSGIDKKIQFAKDHLVRSSESHRHHDRVLTRANGHHRITAGRGCEEKEGLETRATSPLHINFLSASNFWRLGCWPDRVAAKVNPAILEYLCTQHGQTRDAQLGSGIDSGSDNGNGSGSGGGSTGIVICDWIGENEDWDLVRCIIAMNSRLKLANHSTRIPS